MGSGSWSRKTEITEIMLSVTLCGAENKGKTNESLKIFLKVLGKLSVVSEVQC